MAELVYQDRLLRSRTATALEGLADPTVTRIRLAVAYTTTDGWTDLAKMLKRKLGRGWPAAEKTLITSFDFYLTDPDALDQAVRAGFKVYRGSSRGFAFHPKLYVFDTASGDARVLIGSANITKAAHNDNTEFGIAVRMSADTPELQALEDAWERIVDTAQLLGSPEIARYRADRVRRAPKRRPTPRPPRVPRGPVTGALLPFPNEVVAGRLRPRGFRAFWVEAGTMSSQSRNQLELPRFANYFFGFAFNAHATTPRLQPIGTVRLLMGSQTWPNQQLNWRGAPAMNKMERLYLPTVDKGGVDYSDTGVLFIRGRRGAFKAVVMPWSGATASGWQHTSASRGLLYSVGARSARLCGFL